MVIKAREYTRRGLAGIGALVIWGLAGSAGAEVVASLDRDRVGLGESVTLEIRSRGESLSEEPDLSALGDAFAVLGHSRSLRTTVINGRRDASLDWRIELAPLRPGELEIPPLRLGAERTEPLALNVVSTPAAASSRVASAASSAAPRGVALVAEIDRHVSYVQEQVALTLRVESGVPLLGGALSAPQIPGALVEPLGEGRSEMREEDGAPLYVFEQRYAVFPQESGELEIPAHVFEGHVQAPVSGKRRGGGRRSLLGSRLDAGLGGSLLDDFFGASGGFMGGLGDIFGEPGQRVRALSAPLRLRVEGRPAEARGERFLPARELELVELWPGGASEPPALAAGQPVDRVVAVRARGVLASQLPLPRLAEGEGFKQYSEPAYEDSQQAGEDMLAVRALPTVLIPTRAGSLTLPAVELEWWDTEADAPRTARLPERIVEVGPGSVADLSAPAVPALAPAISDSEGPPPAGEIVETPPVPGLGPWGLGLAGLAFVLALISGAWVWRRGAGPASPAPGGRRSLEAALGRACTEGNAAQADRALLALGRQRWPLHAPKTATDFAARLASSDLETAVAGLAAHRFGAQASNAWPGADLWLAYRKASRSRRRLRGRGHRREVLPELYPAR